MMTALVFPAQFLVASLAIITMVLNPRFSTAFVCQRLRHVHVHNHVHNHVHVRNQLSAPGTVPTNSRMPRLLGKNPNSIMSKMSKMSRLYMSTDSSSNSIVLTAPPSINVSRLSTLQTLLLKAGAPGSQSCTEPNDLQPVSTFNPNLHPHLYPIAQSKTNPSQYICGLRRAYADDAMYESSSNSPWPIVEAKENGIGYNLISLNSEHLMRRIAAQADSDSETETDTETDKQELDLDVAKEIIDIYNLGLGQGLVEKSFDSIYDPGSVSKLGYGPEKYILLRVGPFPDLYNLMALNHHAKSDESSSLIAAEASNGKFSGFASTFKFYASLLNIFPNRTEECKDAARVCLRMPLPSIGMNYEDFVNVAKLASLLNENDQEDNVDDEVYMTKMKEMYEKIRAHEEEDEQAKANMTPSQMAIEDGNKVLDRMVFVNDHERQWKNVRKELGDIYEEAGLLDMAIFVDPTTDRKN